MKLRKIAMIVLAGVLTMAPGTWAQDGAPGQQRQNAGAAQRKRFQAIAKQLNLTQQQFLEIRNIMRRQHEQMMALRDNMSLGDQDRKVQAQQIRKQAHDAFVAMLSDDQKLQFAGMMEQYRKEQQERRAQQQNAGQNQEDSANESSTVPESELDSIIDSAASDNAPAPKTVSQKGSGGSQ